MSEEEYLNSDLDYDQQYSDGYDIGKDVGRLGTTAISNKLLYGSYYRPKTAKATMDFAKLLPNPKQIYEYAKGSRPLEWINKNPDIGDAKNYIANLYKETLKNAYLYGGQAKCVEALELRDAFKERQALLNEQAGLLAEKKLGLYLGKDAPPQPSGFSGGFSDWRLKELPKLIQTEQDTINRLDKYGLDKMLAFRNDSASMDNVATRANEILSGKSSGAVDPKIDKLAKAVISNRKMSSNGFAEGRAIGPLALATAGISMAMTDPSLVNKAAYGIQALSSIPLVGDAVTTYTTGKVFNKAADMGNHFKSQDYLNWRMDQPE